MDRHFLSIVMPALNEEKNILSAINNTLKAFYDFKVDGEVIVVNDGSEDKTPELVRELISKGETRVRLLNHDAPQGIGASFWDGILNAKGKAVCMLPGDNENDPHEILRYLQLLDHVHMVVPFVCNKQVRSRSRNFLSCLYTSIINITFRTSFNYTNGTVLYKRHVLSDIHHRCRSFFFQTDVLVRLTKRGCLFAEVPYKLGSRKRGKSKAISFRSSVQIVKGYLNLVKDVYFKRVL